MQPIRNLSFLYTAGFALLFGILILPEMAFSMTGLDFRPSNTTCTAPERPQTNATIELQPVLPSLDISWPLDMVQSPNDPTRWYVVDRSGFIAVYTKGNTFTRAGTLLDIQDRVLRIIKGVEKHELGLLGVAFHPDFTNNGEVFLYYSANAGNPSGMARLAARVSRFISTDGGLTVDPDSEQIIFSFDRQRASHMGGRIAFGVDGFLYISLGDAAIPDTAQNKNSIWGKMLRIDVDNGSPYAIPEDNPKPP